MIFTAKTKLAGVALAVLSASFSAFPVCAQSLDALWKSPTADYRIKTWWFFGYERTTDEGIKADVKALKDAGFGGVVYYDQNHSRNPEANGAEAGFSPEWWRHVKLAAREAGNAGLTFELNISNGYVAGGRWITPRYAMQRVSSAECVVMSDGTAPVCIAVPDIKGRDGYVDDIAFMAVRCREDGMIRHITASYKASGKGRNGAMQRPLHDGETGFQGYGFVERPDLGVLQASDDSVLWRDIVTLKPMYASLGGYSVRTNAFKADAGKYWRVKYAGTDTLKAWSVGGAAKMDRWEELSALHSDFREGDATPDYENRELVALNDIVDVTGYVNNGTLQCALPEGKWRIMRFAAVLTGGRSKHGRTNLLGYECDKLSKAAAQLHWDSYMQVILDSLRADGINNVAGVTMDSHESGSQNWTPLMFTEFKARRGYDVRPYLPVLAGYIVESKEKTEQVLYDYRMTVSDCVADNYYGTFQRRAAENGIRFTAQAIGNALCIVGDAVAVKKAVDRPQGEFWAYQKDGAFDIKDCSSAAHLYGKPVASAEAMTDVEYKDNPADLKRVADIAFAFGAQEMVICATPHIPEQHPTVPYVAGREYAVNRSNPKWEMMKPVWEAAARSMVMLRQGEAAPDVLIYWGDDVPVKTLAHRLPAGIGGLDWDVCTGDALQTRTDYIRNTYKAVIVADGAFVSKASAKALEELSAAGIPILRTGETVRREVTLTSDDVVHTHRKFVYKGRKMDLFFLANKEEKPVECAVRFAEAPGKVTVWDTATGRRETLKAASDGSFVMKFAGNESVFVTF